MQGLAVYDIRGNVEALPELRRTEYDAAEAGARILEPGWPDERSFGAALIDPLEPSVITRLFEEGVTDAG